MTNKNLFEEIEKLQSISLDIIKRKNNDYSSTDDPFLNFREFGKYGFLVRISDKWSRLKQLLSGKEQKVTDETIKDTLIDMSNYLLLLAVYLDNEK